MPERLGQHFLENPIVLRYIAKLVDPENHDTIIEIGPGHGELTQELRIRNEKSKIIAIEKDPWLAKALVKKFAADQKIEILTGDILKIFPNLTKNSPPATGNYKIVGNIPYYITGKILRLIGALSRRPEKIVLMVQQEVAERIVSRPPKMNLLSAIIQSWSQPAIRRRVPRGDFRPAPAVDSAVLELIPRQEEAGAGAQETFYDFIRIVFKQPRKPLANNLVAGKLADKAAVGEILARLGFDSRIRPQNISLEDLVRLKNFLP